MTDFKRDLLTGDLDISSGGLELVTGGEEAAQRLSLALSLNLGEWFLDVSAGLPYIRNNDEDFSDSIRFMLGDKFADTPEFIFSTITKYISDQTFIRSVVDASFEFDDKTRQFSYSADLVGQDGVEFTITPFDVQL